MKKLLSDTAYTGISHFTAAVSQIALQIFVVRFTSTKEFGEYTTALAIENILESIFIVRSGEMALQYVGKYWVTGDQIIARICAERIRQTDWIINFTIYALIVGFALTLAKTLGFKPIYLIGLGLIIPAQISYSVYKSLFIANAKLKEQAIFEISFSSIQLIIGSIGVYFFSIPGLIAASVFANLAKNLLARAITNRWWLPEAFSSLVSSEKELVDFKSWWSFGFHSVLRNTFSSASIGLVFDF